ncbi:MAG: hypothetical protein ACHQ9S_13530 [Candidatus Binatia bacterium]
MLLSVKSQRLLKDLGVITAFEHGEQLVLVGRTYELRKDPGVRVRLAFLHDPDGRLCVGYAEDSDGWHAVEFEPFSLRAFGYYQRRVKRIGDVIEAGLGHGSTKS